MAHAYVATELCAFVLLLETESGVNTTSVIPAVYVHPLVAATHVGAAALDHVTAPALIALHERVTAPGVSVYPARQTYVAVTALDALYAYVVLEYVM